VPVLFEREGTEMPTAIERWRTRGAQERAEKRRARLREELPMGAYRSEMSFESTYDPVTGETTRIPPKKKKKKKNPFKKLFGMEE
jgi:hypothetical protein